MENQTAVQAKPKRVPSLKELKRAAMMKHFDSHHFLAKHHGEKYKRPVLLDVAVKSKAKAGCNNSLIINESAVNHLAVMAKPESILIMDATAISGIRVSSARIQYVVGVNHFINSYEEPEGSDYAIIRYLVPSVKDALEHISKKLAEVSAHADLKKPDELSKEQWSFMSTREIRIVGNFKLLADGIEYANQMVAHAPGDASRSMFTSFTTGARAFGQNNLAKIIQIYKEKPELVQELEAPSNPYEWFAWTNARKLYASSRIDAQFLYHYKNEHNQYKLTAYPREVTDLIIADHTSWKELGASDAFVALVASGQFAEIIRKEIGDNAKVISVFNTKYEAIDYVSKLLQMLAETESPVGILETIKNVTKVHVFNDIIEDAY